MCLSDPATAGRLCPGPGRLVRAVSWPGAPSLCPSLACSSSTAVRTQVLGQPLRHASNKQQTVEGFMLSTRGAARAPGLLCGQRGSGEGPWAQPGCDCAEPGGRLHGCPRKGSAGGPGPQGPAAHSLPAPVSRPPPRLPAWARPRDGFLLREPLGAAGSERHPRSCSDQVSLVSRSGSQPAPRAAPTLWSTRALFSKVLVDV